ncbi:MAG TPA: recombinase family protein [Fervidobacterium sp.]|nr:recombinase family protein [Fervidobacterium sp.]
MNRKYGYIRVSSVDQNIERQKNAMRKVGIRDDCLFIDKQSGKDFSRPAYQKLVNQCRESDISHKEDGSLDTTQYQMASAMLSYISANSIGINDGMNYVDDCIDVVQSRETFEMIFKFMSQEQHYKMMMGIK